MIFFKYYASITNHIVEEKANLMKMFPRDPVVHGSFFKFNKKYAKSRKKKTRGSQEPV